VKTLPAAQDYNDGIDSKLLIQHKSHLLGSDFCESKVILLVMGVPVFKFKAPRYNLVNNP
jgi:hypothetical protein